MPAQITSPSRLLLRFEQTFSREFPALDAGCGAGRNAIALAQLGLTIVCADRDEQRLSELVTPPTNWARGAPTAFDDLEIWHGADTHKRSENAKL
jgi:hypothetical protein